MVKKIILIVVIWGLLGSGAYAFYRWQKYYKEESPVAVDIRQIVQQKRGEVATQTIENDTAITQASSQESLEEIPKTMDAMPSTLNLKMDFYAQAPLGNWDYPWQEACEEASVLLIANTYYQHQWTAKQFNEEILKLVKWEKEYFGAYEHTTVEQTEEMLNKYLKLRTKIHENPSYEDIQQILGKGHLIVMTFAGKQIGNPNYKNGGPIYHAMVIKGYKEGEKLITQDVGTRRGADYVYRWKTLQHALHDYAEPIEKGEKRLIEVFPPENL